MPGRILGTWAQEADQRGQLPKVEEEEGGAGPWDWACRAPFQLWAEGGSGEQVGGINGRVGCSQEEPGRLPARMGLLRAADGGLRDTAGLSGSRAVPASVPGSSLLVGDESGSGG